MLGHTVKPVILYGSEIWGLIPNYKQLNECSAENYFFKLCNESVFEKIHLKACNSFWGINRRATNLAVVGETGRYPFMFDIVVNMFKYYKILCTSCQGMLIKNPLLLMARTRFLR